MKGFNIVIYKSDGTIHRQYKNCAVNSYEDVMTITAIGVLLNFLCDDKHYLIQVPKNFLCEVCEDGNNIEAKSA